MLQQDHPPKTQEEIEKEQELAAEANLDTPEGRVGVAREKYISKYLEYRTGWRNALTMRKLREGMGLLTAKEEKTEREALAEFKQPYNEARIALGNKRIEDFKKSLAEANPELSPENIDAAVSLYKETELKNELIIKERQIRIDAEIAKSASEFVHAKKFWGWYSRLPRPLKVTLNTALFTGAMAAGVASSAAMTTLGLGYTGYAGLKIATGLTSGYVGMKAGKGVDAFKKKSDEEFKKQQELKEKDLVSKFKSPEILNQEKLEELEEGLDVNEKEKRIRNRNRLITKMAISMAVGAGTGAAITGGVHMGLKGIEANNQHLDVETLTKLNKDHLQQDQIGVRELAEEKARMVRAIADEKARIAAEHAKEATEEATNTPSTVPVEHPVFKAPPVEAPEVKHVVMADEPPDITTGDLKMQTTVDVTGTGIDGLPAAFKITNMAQLKLAIDDHSIGGIHLDDEAVSKLKDAYDHQLSMPSNISSAVTPVPEGLPRVSVPVEHPIEHPVGQVHAPAEIPPVKVAIPLEHHEVFVGHNHFNTIDEVRARFGTHNLIAEPASGRIHGMSYQDWNHHAAEFLKQHADIKVGPESAELNRLFATTVDTPQGVNLDTIYYLGRPHWEEISHMPAKDLMHFKASDLADMEKHDFPTLQRLVNNGLVKPLGNHRFEFTYENHELERLQHIMKRVDPGHWRPYTTPPESVEDYIKRAVTAMKINETEDGTLWVIKEGKLTSVLQPQPGQYLGQYPGQYSGGINEYGRIAPVYTQYNTGGIPPIAPRYGVFNEGYNPMGHQPRFTTKVPWTNEEIVERYGYGVSQGRNTLVRGLIGSILGGR